MPSACSGCRRAACWHAGQVSGPPVSVSPGRSGRCDGIRRCRPPRGRGGRWRDPPGRGFPRGGETPPRRRPACRRNNGSARPARSTGRRIATNPPAERESGIDVAIGDHVAGEDANARRDRGPSGAVVVRRPLVIECLRGCVAVEPFAGPVEPAPDPMSLYAPPRSPTTKARKWSRAAIASGVERLPEM